MASQELMEVLGEVLGPFPEGQRKQMLAWAARVMDSGSVLQIVQNDAGVVWEIGKASPHNGAHTIFAILVDAVGRVVAYSFAVGKDDQGREGALYFKEVVFTPRTAFGPISGQGLFNDWAAIMGGEDEPDPGELANGAHAPGPNGAA